MTDEEYELQLQRVRALIETWLDTLGLANLWRIQFYYCRDYPEKQGALMTCESSWEYLIADIIVYLPEIAEIDDDYLEYALLHEFAHLFLCELRDKSAKDFRGHEERVATLLGRSWQRVRNMNREEDNAETTDRHESEGDGEATIVTPSHDSLRQGY